MDRIVPFEQGEFYHVYNRGAENRPLFLDVRDWTRFQILLRASNSLRAIKIDRLDPDPYAVQYGERIVDVIAYAQMPNHFHIVMGERSPGGISKFMSKLLTSYSMYFNKKYERSGPLMCRPFRSSHIANDDYFRWVLSYVHLNHLPVPTARLFSSYPDYYEGERKETAILSREASPIPRVEMLEMGSLQRYLAAGHAAGMSEIPDKFLRS
jgi:putative transposase